MQKLGRSSKGKHQRQNLINFDHGGRGDDCHGGGIGRKDLLCSPGDDSGIQLRSLHAPRLSTSRLAVSEGRHIVAVNSRLYQGLHMVATQKPEHGATGHRSRAGEGHQLHDSLRNHHQQEMQEEGGC